MVLVAPSLLAADFGKLAEQISMVEKAGADWLHFDIMDGHFVPNLSYGADLVKQMRPLNRLFFDVHLMVEEPLNFVPMFLDCGADLITVHYEACSDLSAVLRLIKQHNIKAGVSLKPKTAPDVLRPYLNEIDNILVMTVEPGFGGQSFMADQLPKIARIKELCRGHNIYIEVDGGITPQTAVTCVKNGADVLVAGSAVFKNPRPDEIIKQLHHAGD